jgi:hypothetical protein
MQPVPATERVGSPSLCHAVETLPEYRHGRKIALNQPRALAVQPTVKNGASR